MIFTIDTGTKGFLTQQEFNEHLRILYSLRTADPNYEEFKRNRKEQKNLRKVFGVVFLGEKHDLGDYVY